MQYPSLLPIVLSVYNEYAPFPSTVQINRAKLKKVEHQFHQNRFYVL